MHIRFSDEVKLLHDNEMKCIVFMFVLSIMVGTHIPETICEIMINSKYLQPCLS